MPYRISSIGTVARSAARSVLFFKRTSPKAVNFAQNPNLPSELTYLHYCQPLLDSLSLFAASILCFQYVLSSFRKKQGGGLGNASFFKAPGPQVCLPFPCSSTIVVILTHLCPELTCQLANC